MTNYSHKRGSVSLADILPNLHKYYKPELNEGKLMSEISRGLNRAIVLCCDVCETKNKFTPFALTRKYPNGSFHTTYWCTYCNSIGLIYPELALQWSDKNEKSAFEFSFSSNKKVWWKCVKKHEWQSSINNRTNKGNDCPSCNNSKGEEIISDWLLKNDIRYFPQYFAGGKLYDLYLSEEQIFVEVHGSQHFEENTFFTTPLAHQQKIDKQKREYAEANGQYIMVDYREHKPELALERFIDALAELP